MRRITVIGNLTANAEVKDVNGKKAINFSVATNEKYKDATGNVVEKSFYYNSTIWRDSNVNIAQYLTKGTKVYIEGTPDVDVFTDKNGGVKGSIKINVSNIELIGGGSKEGTQTKIDNQPTTSSTPTPERTGNSFVDDLPF